MQAEIVSIGTELLLGDLVDTNAAFIARQFAALGLNLYYKTVVGDNLARIAAILQEVHQRSEVVVATGGLGPTLDDLTREAVAHVLGVDLVFDPRLMEQIEAVFLRYGTSLTPNNRRQAYLPKGALPIENPVGTAPGFIARDRSGIIIALPGVPAEMQYLMEHSVIPFLRGELNLQEVIISRTLKLCGLGESRVDDLLNDLISAGNNPTIGLLAKGGEIHIRLTAKAVGKEAGQRLIAPLEEEVRRRLPGLIFGVDEETLEEAVGRLLAGQGLTFSTVESMPGASLSQRLSRGQAGHDHFRGGITAPNPAQLLARLQVDLDLVAQDGERGETFPVLAEALAQGIRRWTGSDLGLALIGPAPDSEENRMVVALAGHEGVRSRNYTLARRALWAQDRPSILAMEMLRKYLLALSAGKGDPPSPHP